MKRKPRILVVSGKDDCGCLISSLQTLGQVEVATSLGEAIGRIQAENFDVVFSAWDLEGGNWSDLLTAAKEKGVNSPVSVVYYHCAGEDEWMDALQAGAFDLLAPPFDPYKLSVVLEHALASKQDLASVA